MEDFTAQITANNDSPDTLTSDDIYWCNLVLKVSEQDVVSACDGDFDKDGDVDGSDSAQLAADPDLLDLSLTLKLLG
jgi:hypothetical protein